MLSINDARPAMEVKQDSHNFEIRFHSLNLTLHFKFK